MKKKRTDNGLSEETRAWRHLVSQNEAIDISITVVSILFSIAAAIDAIAIIFLKQSWMKWVQFVAFILLTAILVLAIIFKCINFKKRKRAFSYEKAKIIDRIDKAVFASLNSANAAKVRSTLRFTYGNVHDWNPINYRKNVLVYDVHEHIRTILLNLRDVIIQTSPERLHEDNVTVDIIWCYPKEKDYSGYLPYIDESGTHKKPWKLISTGDKSASAHTIQEWVASKDSFYAAVIQKGYLCSDKKDLVGQYHVDTKDKEYNPDIQALSGSIAGVVIDVKNDEPSRVLVRAILTVNTFGTNFYDADSFLGVSKTEYEEILKRRIITVYKSLLASELVQMYIRHSIREDGRCPITGSLPDESEDEKTRSKGSCSPGKCNPRDCSRLKSELDSFGGL